MDADAKEKIYTVTGEMISGDLMLQLSAPGGERVATLKAPGAGSKLSRLAFGHGATKVLHLYDLRKDEI